MIPRGKIDIGFKDILAGFYYCLSGAPGSAGYFESRAAGPGALYCLSVRSGFDLILRALKLPAGSEIIITDINIPGMFEIIAAHGLRAVAVPVNKHTLNMSPASFSGAISPASKAVLFTHLFGGIMEIDEQVKLAKARGLIVIEDCAQAYIGAKYTGNPFSDAVMFSFGMIKTNTALGGGLIYFNNTELYQEVKKLQELLPLQERKVYLKKLILALLIKVITLRGLYGVFYRLIITAGKDPDSVLSGFTRGFKGESILHKIRFKPCAPLLRMLDRKIGEFNQETITARAAFGRKITGCIPGSMLIGQNNERNSFWILPVEAADPGRLIDILRREGFDATAKASSLQKLVAEGKNGEAVPDELYLRNLVYLPMSPRMNEKDIEKLCSLIAKLHGVNKYLNIEN